LDRTNKDLTFSLELKHNRARASKIKETLKSLKQVITWTT